MVTANPLVTSQLLYNMSARIEQYFNLSVMIFSVAVIFGNVQLKYYEKCQNGVIVKKTTTVYNPSLAASLFSKQQIQHFRSDSQCAVACKIEI